jgi:hypothetical protein
VRLTPEQIEKRRLAAAALLRQVRLSQAAIARQLRASDASVCRWVATLGRVLNGISRAAEFIGAEEQELAMDLGHGRGRRSLSERGGTARM